MLRAAPFVRRTTFSDVTEHASGRSLPLVLVVDDEPSVLHVTARLVAYVGYAVESFTDPLEALTAFSRNPDRFAVALLDVMTPAMSGPELARRLRELSPALPVIMATGFSDLLPEALSAAERPTALLHKPVPLEALRTALHQIVPPPSPDA